MISSALISKKQKLEAQLRHQQDPARRAQLLAMLQGIEAGIRAMGFSQDEIKTNDVVTDKPEVRSSTFMVPLPEWTTTTANNANQEMPKNTVREYREQMLARGENSKNRNYPCCKSR
jgi:hypothetical protein